MDLNCLTDFALSWAPGVNHAWLAWTTLAWKTLARQAPASLQPTVFNSLGQPRTFTTDTPARLWT